MRTQIVTAALVALLGGCTHTQPLDPSSLESRAAVNAQAERGSAAVVLANGERVEAPTLRLDVTGATWVDPETGAARSAPYADIRSVRVVRRRRGALEGLGIGALIGAALSAPGAIALGQYVGAGPTAGIIAASALMGGGVGALIGWDKARTAYSLEVP